ncbi:MAG: VWA domain-containing protein [Burkholderiales bacterium]|nr:VWA domain-containing protein [Burkholderiales bacterium]
MKSFRLLSVVGVFAVAAPGAWAQSISPASYAATINIGQTITIDKTITLAAAGATKVDVVFLADNTGSMGGTVNNAKAGATAIMSGLSGDYNFGVARYYGDPSEYGMSPSTSFNYLTPLTSSVATAQTGVNAWNASGGGDTPEANYFALKQTADTSAWRSDAQRIVVWFGDAPSHTETTTKTDAINALTAAGAKVVAFNNGSVGSGLDGAYGADTNQASSLVGAVGGSLTNNFTSLSSSQFVTKVTEQISLASSSLNLFFGSNLAGSGLTLGFTCTDVLGCNNVSGGESRTFRLSITGNLAGTYAFDVFARGIAATEHDVITVAAVPEPSAALMVLGGAGVLGLMMRRRKSA